MYTKTKLLIIDDERTICSLIKLHFETEGYIVYAASDIQEGKKMPSNRPDLILLDINIPDETEILITTAHMTADVNRVVEFVSRLDGAPTIISGIREDKVELLNQESIVRIYAEKGKVFARTEQGLYQIRLRLYEIEERLDNGMFVRISNSEIVNFKKVKSLDLSFVGTICMELSNGEVSYVSRRYVSKIKKVLGL